MARLRFGIAAHCPDLAGYQEWAKLAEGCGYDMLGFGDSPCLLPELGVGLAAMAMCTDRVVLCPTVSNPLTRHPSVTASAFAALRQLAPGRIWFGMGSGDSAALSIGERPASVAAMRDYGRAFSALTRGEEAEWRGRRFRLEWETDRVPLWLAAGGPKTMRLAGEIADGVLLGAGLSESVVRDSIGQVREGARAAGRDPASIEIWGYTKIFLCESEEQAWHDLAWTLAASAHHAFRFTLEDKFVPDEWHDALEELQRGYVVREHNNLANVGTTNADLVIESGLTEFLGPRFLVAGSPARVVERLEEIASWGVAGFFTTGMFGEPLAYTREIAADVLARLSADSATG
jgi:5,10-methylenetetrahydromethanopterin reductase